MLDLRDVHVPVFQPLLQLPGVPDTIGWQPRALLREACQQAGISLELLSSLDHRVEQVADNLVVHRRSVAKRRAVRVNVLRRQRRRRDQRPVPGTATSTCAMNSAAPAISG